MTKFTEAQAQAMYDALYELTTELNIYDVPQEASCYEVHGEECSGFCEMSALGKATAVINEIDGGMNVGCSCGNGDLGAPGYDPAVKP